MQFLGTQDYVLHKRIREKLLYLHNNSFESMSKPLKNYMNCLKKVMPSGVTILKRRDKIRFHGLTHCRNIWACPTCAPTKMQRVKAKLTAAFDLMKEQGYKCCMVTYTVPHQRTEHYEQDGNVKYRNIIPFATMLYVLRTAFAKFWHYQSMQKIRKGSKNFHIIEITYSDKNGWHPHFHTLCWYKPEQFEKIAKMEQNSRKNWYNCLLNAVEEITWDNDSKNILKKFITYNKEHMDSANSAGYYISKNDDGTIREFTASNYFWSGENEVADLYKKIARDGHLNQWQILQLATRSDDNLKYVKLIEEILEATYWLKMFKFSPGFSKMLDEYIQEHGIATKKKSGGTDTDSTENTTKVICWLSAQQWNLLIYREHIANLTVILSSFAIQDNAFELIKEFCTVFKIGEPKSSPPFKIKLPDEQVA